MTTTKVDPYKEATMELINNQYSNIKGIRLETQHNAMATKMLIMFTNWTNSLLFNNYINNES